MQRFNRSTPDFLVKMARPGRAQGRALLAVLIIAALAFLSVLLRSALQKQAPDAAAVSGEAGRRALPDDVEAVLTSFGYSEADEQVRIKISGKRAVRRGRRLLGLRSNLVKTNFIEQISGTVQSAKGTTTFAAARGEWDADSSRPLLLKKEVSLTVCGKPLAGVKSARIYLKSGVIEIDDGRSYSFK